MEPTKNTFNIYNDIPSTNKELSLILDEIRRLHSERNVCSDRSYNKLTPEIAQLNAKIKHLVQNTTQYF